MQPASFDEHPRPPALPLVFASVGFAGIGVFAWLVVALAWVTEGSVGGLGLWLLLAAALIGTASGSVATYASRRWWPFFIGVAITLIPIVLAALLVITASHSAAD